MFGLRGACCKDNSQQQCLGRRVTGLGVGGVWQAEALFQQFKAKKEVLQGKSKEQVMAKYGSAAKQPDDEVLALAQSENYVEYNAQVTVFCNRAISKHAYCPIFFALHALGYGCRG